MKIIKTSKYIRTDTKSDVGTTYYEAKLKDVQNALGDGVPSDDVNLWTSLYVDKYGFDAIDFDHNLFGSYIQGDKIYICITDGYDINVNGEDVDPETALDKYSIEELSAYVKPADDEIITKAINHYELKQPIPFDELAEDGIDIGYSFTELVKSGMDVGLEEEVK